MKKTIIQFGITLLVILFTTCSEENSPISDAQQLAALKNVTFTYDSVGYELLLPPAALDGGTFAELLKKDSSKYANPENYGVNFNLSINADNTASNSKDAKFDGMEVGIVMSDIVSGPFALVADAFTIAANTEKQVQAVGAINMATHKATCLYIFRQVVDGNDLSTTLATKLFYEIGLLSGEIPLPEVHKDIPTRASEETKEFLRGLLESEIFQVP